MVPPPLDLTPWVRRRNYSRTLSRLPDRFVPASVPCKTVSRPLAASLLLTHCGCGLIPFFQGCTLFRFNEKDFRDGGLQISTLRRTRKCSGKRFAHQAR